MINNLRLQYFRKHIDREFHFEPGINAIRGANEQGKTTITEAFAYLCFGARALKESLEDVVTYDQPVSKLRVEGTITHLGVVYTTYRAKSGAEVTFGQERVTGQTEVTRFFEHLFGVDATMAGRLMISSQKAIAASITAGPTEAGKLIETLANFDLIEEIVERAQAKLACGLTTGVEGRIASLQAQITNVAPAEDLTLLRSAVTTALASQIQAGVAHENLQEMRDNLDVDLAKSILADEARLSAVISDATCELGQLDGKLAVEAPMAPEPAELARARAAVEAEKGYIKAAVLHAELTKASVVDEWNKDLASLEAEIATTESSRAEQNRRYEEAKNSIQATDNELAKLQKTYAVAKATLEGRLIKETTCAFCDKDLTDVPEVVTRNSELSDELTKLENNTASLTSSMNEGRTTQRGLRDTAEASRKVSETYLADLRGVLARNDKVELLYAKAGDLITVDRSTVPGLWAWAGPEISSNRPDVADELRTLEVRERAAVAFTASRAEQQAQRDAVKLKQSAASGELESLQVKDAKETLTEAAALDPQVTAAGAVFAEAKAATEAAQNVLTTATALQEQAVKAAALMKAQLASAEKDLAETVSNNLLIKKIKSARPVITNKLWSIVLASSSNHFSEVRGEPSSVTRDEKMFRVNGKPAAGLSGSAEDMLGLAVRISLTKTFLSSLGFLILDEPASACSNAREGKMLGMLATLGFEQILLVTHSDLADAYCDNMILV